MLAQDSAALTPRRPGFAGPIPLVSIIIRTYNESKHLGAALRAVGVQAMAGRPPVEVIVVDSGSTDGTREIALAAGARVIGIDKSEFTFGRSLNRGCEAARGEFLVFISGHCIPVEENWLEQMIAPFADPGIVMTYGRQVGAETTKFSEARVYEKYYPNGPASQSAIFCNNANCAVRRSVWRRFRFDETLTGLEDMDLGRKVVDAGFRIAYAPGAPVIHIHDETWPQVRRRYEREAIALRRIAPEFHLSPFDAIGCFLTGVLQDMLAAIKSPAAWGHVGSIVLYRFNQYLGSWLGGRPHRELSRKEKLRYFYPV